jgi:hypothetical protein
MLRLIGVVVAAMPAPITSSSTGFARPALAPAIVFSYLRTISRT